MTSLPTTSLVDTNCNTDQANDSCAPVVIPEQIYHSILLYSGNGASGAPFPAFVLGTHTDLTAARRFAETALFDLGYQNEDFAKVEVRSASHNNNNNNNNHEWKHGDGTIVWAQAVNGGVVKIFIVSQPNTEGLPAGPDHTLALPHGTDQLHYVVRTVILNDTTTTTTTTTTTRQQRHQQRQHQQQRFEIEGAYARRADAMAAAHAQLDALAAACDVFDVLDVGEDPDHDQGGSSASEGGDWPFGESIVLHATARTGEHYYIAVETAEGCWAAGKSHAVYHRKAMASLSSEHDPGPGLMGEEEEETRVEGGQGEGSSSSVSHVDVMNGAHHHHLR